MIYKCKNCKRIIANISDSKNMKLKGKSIEFIEKEIIIKCKCGKDNIIEIKKGEF